MSPSKKKTDDAVSEEEKVEQVEKIQITERRPVKRKGIQAYFAIKKTPELRQAGMKAWAASKGVKRASLEDWETLFANY